jgi:predicted TIM-barrel fold metal-dependent hydrolase
MAPASTGASHDDDDDIDAQTARAVTHLRHSGCQRPIFETHIHFYQVTRAGGVPWPPQEAPLLYRDVLPAQYKASPSERHRRRRRGRTSALVEDNQWILDLIRGDDFFKFVVGSLEIGAPDFSADLSRFARDRRWVGVRSFLWGQSAITLDAAQRNALDDLSQRGLTLDIISRGTINPKPTIEALCVAHPKLRVIVDHLGGAQGTTPTAEWAVSMRRLADRCPNLHMKFSSFYDMHRVSDDDSPWVAPVDLAAYEAQFDVLMAAFGPNRLIFGSNWPVSDLGGSFSQQLAIAEQYLAPLGEDVRDKVMFRNAMKFYRRVIPR